MNTKPVQLKPWHETFPGGVVPPVLTDVEVATYLRFEHDVNPLTSVKRYRTAKRLRGVRVGKYIRYRREDVEAFMESLAKEKGKS